MKCEAALGLLSDYIEGGPRAAEVAEHIASCPSCRAVAHDVAAIVIATAASPAPEPPPFLATRVMQAVRDSAATKAPVWRVPALVGAATLAIAVFAIITGGQDNGPVAAIGLVPRGAAIVRVEMRPAHGRFFAPRPEAVVEPEVFVAATPSERDTSVGVDTVPVPSSWVHVGRSPFVAAPGVTVGDRRYTVPHFYVPGDTGVITSVPVVDVRAINGDF